MNEVWQVCLRETASAANCRWQCVFHFTLTHLQRVRQRNILNVQLCIHAKYSRMQVKQTHTHSCTLQKYDLLHLCWWTWRPSVCMTRTLCISAIPLNIELNTHYMCSEWTCRSRNSNVHMQFRCVYLDGLFLCMNNSLFYTSKYISEGKTHFITPSVVCSIYMYVRLVSCCLPWVRNCFDFTTTSCSCSSSACPTAVGCSQRWLCSFWCSELLPFSPSPRSSSASSRLLTVIVSGNSAQLHF